MHTLDLPRLERDGFLDVSAEIPADYALWAESEMAFEGPVRVEGRATLAGSGEIILDATVSGAWRQECRRCLEEVVTPLELKTILVFGDTAENDGDDGEIHPADLDANELDFGPAVREELLLTMDPYRLCEEGCRGLCPNCGVNRNRESCECTLEESDPRWDALRKLKSE